MVPFEPPHGALYRGQTYTPPPEEVKHIERGVDEVYAKPSNLVFSNKTNTRRMGEVYIQHPKNRKTKQSKIESYKNDDFCISMVFQNFRTFAFLFISHLYTVGIKYVAIPKTI